MEEGVKGLLRDKTRNSGNPPTSEKKVHELLTLALGRPPDGEMHWTVRALAKGVGIGRATAHRILVRHKIKPHRVKSFKVSTDPEFAKKTYEVTGLYMDPPDRAVVLSIDEKTQIQALGWPATMTHDYKQNGTTALFAALNTLDGTVIGRHSERRRHQEFIAFLDQIDREVPTERPIHAIVDNYSAHKHKAVMDWLKEYDRWTFRYTPTSCFWMNAVEGFFGKLARRRIRRGVYDSIEDLERSILDFIDLHNENEAKPFGLTTSPERPVASHQ